MGVVYRACQLGFGRPCAVKMVRTGHQAGSEELARFRTEAQALARLQHPNIVQVFEVGWHEGLPFFSMEFCPGGSLDARLGGTPMEPLRAAALVEALARATHAAHQARVVHRDLKPANVLLAEDGSPKITDFGLAKKLDELGHTRTGDVMGTPSYMAPEQADGRGAGPLADVWALGAILYECLTGRPPFKAATPLDTLAQVIRDDPVPVRYLQPRLPTDLDTICLKCLNKDPPRRYGSADELAEDLRRFQHSEPIAARPTPAWERAWKWCRRRPTAAALLAVSLLSAILLATGGVAYARMEKRRAAAAEGLRRDAERERERAEGHFLRAREAVDQMLLRVGGERLAYEPRMEQIRRGLLEQAVTFYDSFLKAEGGSPAVRYEAAVASRKVGQIRALLGQHEAAEKAQRRSMAWLDRLLEEEPGHARYTRDLAAVCADLGSLLRQTRRQREAGSLLARAIRLQERLLAESPGDRLNRRDLAAAHYNLGLLHESAGRPWAAEKSYRAALALQEKLVSEARAEASYRLELARTWSALGNLQGKRHPADAERSLRAARSLFADLQARLPGVPAVRQELLLVSLRLGDLMQTRQPEEAVRLFRGAAAAGQTLVGDFPTVPDYQQQLAASLNSLGSQLLFTGRRGEAEKAFERSRELKERLAGNFPRRADYRRDLARTCGNQGLLLQTAHRDAAAEQVHRRAVQLLRGLVNEFPQSHADQEELALALVRLGTSVYKSDPNQAVSVLREALALQDRLVEGGTAGRDYRDARGRTCSLLGVYLHGRGREEEAEKLHRRAEADFRLLAARYPAEPEYRQLLALSLNNLGEFFHRTGRAGEAERAWKESSGLLEALAKESPGRPQYLREQARALHNLGVLYKDLKRLDEAGAAHRRALALRRWLAENSPREPGYKYERASSLAELAIVLALGNSAKTAEAHFREAVVLLEGLVTSKPSGPAYAGELLRQDDNLAGLLRTLCREGDVTKWWKRRVTLMNRLADAHPEEPGYQHAAARALQRLGEQLVRERRLDEARSHFKAAVHRQKAAVERAPKEVPFRLELCGHHLSLAGVQVADKDHAAAAKTIEEMLALAPPEWRDWKVAAALLGRCAGAVAQDKNVPADKRRDLAKGYGDRALALLVKAQAAGFRDGKALWEAEDFAALRVRQDFRRLVEKLGGQPAGRGK
jgi:tetratricopeptide (TPR) repeat protein